MKMQLQDFKSNYLEILLNFLWRQWSSLGVAGYSEGTDPWVIDPEALLLFTATIARHDQRLFDEVLDWLEHNERFVNIQRLRNIIKKENFQSKRVIGAIAKTLLDKKKGLKWKKLAQNLTDGYNPESLFFLRNGQPMPVVKEADAIYVKYGYLRNSVENRGLSNSFVPGNPNTLLLQLRAIMGVNSRADILLYLLVNSQGNIQTIADQSYYSWRSTQEVLFEMGHSNLLSFAKAKKGRTYFMDSSLLNRQLLKDSTIKIEWINWPTLFRALEIVWLKLSDETMLNYSKLEQAAELKKLMEEEVIVRFNNAGFGASLRNSKGYIGEEYLGFWLDELKRILG